MALSPTGRFEFQDGTGLVIHVRRRETGTELELAHVSPGGARTLGTLDEHQASEMLGFLVGAMVSEMLRRLDTTLATSGLAPLARHQH